MSFSKVIIWGHKLHSHTHSYIFNGFYLGFKALGYDVYWFDDLDNVSNLNLENCLFITENQVDKKIPNIKSSKYVCHSIIKEDKTDYIYNASLILKTFNFENIKNENKINNYTYENSDRKFLIQPWATHLLPNEFDFNQALCVREHKAYFFGSVHFRPTPNIVGWNYNGEEVFKFEQSCNKENINFDFRGLYTKGYISEEENIALMKAAIAAPIIQGSEQISAGYLPCRLWKNISYGHYAITNSSVIYDLFSQDISNIIYDEPENLLYRLLELQNKDIDKNILFQQMKYIQAEHTYLNRIKMIMEKI